MKLSDLKTGMRFLDREGEEFFVLENVKNPYGHIGKMFVSTYQAGWLDENNYCEDMTTKSGNEKFDIMEVYAQNNGEHLDGSTMTDKITDMNLIWKRRKIKKMTVSEICEKLGYEVEIVKED